MTTTYKWHSYLDVVKPNECDITCDDSRLFDSREQALLILRNQYQLPFTDELRLRDKGWVPLQNTPTVTVLHLTMCIDGEFTEVKDDQTKGLE